MAKLQINTKKAYKSPRHSSYLHLSTIYIPLQTLERLRDISAQHATKIGNHVVAHAKSSDKESQT